MNMDTYANKSIEQLEGIIEAKQDDLEEVIREIDLYEEDYTGELIHEKLELEKEIKRLNKILKEKESRC